MAKSPVGAATHGQAPTGATDCGQGPRKGGHTRPAHRGNHQQAQSPTARVATSRRDRLRAWLAPTGATRASIGNTLKF
ncbi:hypothetical protein BHM03_00051179 [Ensete ventricosum]|nr:hypothetical protein BHM03_00051179 [Ensete ventricosum]